MRPSKLWDAPGTAAGTRRGGKEKATKSEVYASEMGANKAKMELFCLLPPFEHKPLADAGRAPLLQRAAGSPAPHGRGQMAGAVPRSHVGMEVMGAHGHPARSAASKGLEHPRHGYTAYTLHRYPSPRSDHIPVE